jgi:hypothetical protein
VGCDLSRVWRSVFGRWLLLSGLVGPVLVVMPLIFGGVYSGVCRVEGQHVIAHFAAERPDSPFAVCVHARCPRRARESVHVFCTEDSVEGWGVLAVSVAEQEAQRVGACAEVRGEVAGLLLRPVPRGVGGDVGDV